MKIIEQIVSRFKFWRFKSNLRNKMHRFNRREDRTKHTFVKREYPKKELEKSENDNQIKAYLSKYRSDIVGIGTGWYPYLYQMIDELFKNGLLLEDKMWAKEKYAEFDCSVKAKNEEKQILYNKIVETYTRVINTTCQFCDNKGVNQTIDSWDYNLCLQHYLENKYQIDIDDEIQDYKDYFDREENETTYKNISTSNYYRLGELLFRKQAEHFHSLLIGSCLIDKNQIQKMMYEYFCENPTNDIELENKSYFTQLRFVDLDNNSVEDMPETEYYNPFKVYEEIIAEICT